MPWKITQHKIERGQQAARVSMMLQEMCMYTFASYSEEFERQFKERLNEIPRTNNFSANHFYKATSRNLKSVEIWKLTIDGEFKDKLFTCDFEESISNF